MTCLSAICRSTSPSSCCEKASEKLRLPQISCNQTHNTFAVSCTAATKDGGSYDGWEVQRGGRKERWGVEEGREALINEKKCIVPVSWADENRQDKVQGRRLRSAAMHKTHKSGERNGGSVYLGSCTGFCVYLQECESLQSDKRLGKKKIRLQS